MKLNVLFIKTRRTVYGLPDTAHITGVPVCTRWSDKNEVILVKQLMIDKDDEETIKTKMSSCYGKIAMKNDKKELANGYYKKEDIKRNILDDFCHNIWSSAYAKGSSANNDMRNEAYIYYMACNNDELLKE